QMRVHKGPWDTIEGDFNNDGHNDIALVLTVGGRRDDHADPIYYLMIATKRNGQWHRLLLESLNGQLSRLDRSKHYTESADHRLYNGELIKHSPRGLLFDTQRQIIGVDTGEKKRLTKAASIKTTFEPNLEHNVTQQAGYVIEKILILPFHWD